jgi:DNA-binding MarR family transcriptional regulator
MTQNQDPTAYRTIIQNRKLTPIQRIILIYLNTLEDDFLEGKLNDLSIKLGLGKSAVIAQTRTLHDMGYLVRENVGKPGERHGIRLSDFRP